MSLCACALALACGDDSGASSGGETSEDASGDASTTGDPSAGVTTGDATTGEPTEFAMTIYPDILAANCSCHVSGALGGLAMTNASIAYQNLVDVESQQVPGRMRVASGASADSYLIDKLNGTHLDVGGSGVVMPKGGTLLGTQIAQIEDWIDNGAQ